ncbi:hypothetical protein ROHU_002904 [Labeo rohita]|uniref:Uncharacterized protein n=1 Tax=Labeo rohita TaxID=84645 RepID=A0A498NWW8_LABRO|nr:hypothetical protein ROHU_002904 [Labeo rohita]
MPNKELGPTTTSIPEKEPKVLADQLRVFIAADFIQLTVFVVTSHIKHSVLVLVFITPVLSITESAPQLDHQPLPCSPEQPQGFRSPPIPWFEESQALPHAFRPGSLLLGSTRAAVLSVPTGSLIPPALPWAHVTGMTKATDAFLDF